MDALIVVMDHAGVPADEFADWYDTEHLPERRALTGWLSGARYLAGTRSVALYDLASLDLLRAERYRRLVTGSSSPWRDRIHRLRNAAERPSRRYECVQLRPGDRLAPTACGFLYLARMDVAAAAEDDFNRWYDEEHLPGLAAVPGVVAARRFRAVNAGAGLHRYLATYHLTTPEAPSSREWRAVLRTDWTRRTWPHVTGAEMTLFRRAGSVAWPDEVDG